jgi:hypothetical protein
MMEVVGLCFVSDTHKVGPDSFLSCHFLVWCATDTLVTFKVLFCRFLCNLIDMVWTSTISVQEPKYAAEFNFLVHFYGRKKFVTENNVCSYPVRTLPGI